MSEQALNPQMPKMKQVLAVLLIVGAMFADVTAYTNYSSGNGGTQCIGDNGRRCPEECDNDICTCLDRSNTGVPAIACLSSDYEVCSVRGDPYVHTFSGEIFSYRIPCTYQLTSGVVKLRDDMGNPSGDFYNFTVYAYNRRNVGKFYPAGFQVDITRSIGPDVNQLSFSVDGRANFGVYTYDSYARIDGGSWFHYAGKEANPILNVDTYSLSFDGTYHRFYFDYPEIGLVIAFRAADDAYRVWEQNYLAGIVVGIKPGVPDTDLNVIGENLCFNLSTTPAEVLDDSLNPEAGLMLLTHNDNTPQLFLEGSLVCIGLTDPIIDLCSDTNKATSINICIQVFQLEQFVNCTTFQDGGLHDSEPLLNLFQSCIKTFCGFRFSHCLTMMQAVDSCDEFAPAALSGFDCNSLDG